MISEVSVVTPFWSPIGKTQTLFYDTMAGTLSTLTSKCIPKLSTHVQNMAKIEAGC